MDDVRDGRGEAARAFLAACGYPDSPIRLLARDASFRAYWRIGRPDGKTAVLMDAPPPQEDVTPFIRVGRHLCALGFSAPAILASDVAAGLVLLEDFGDDTFSRLLTAGADEEALYTMAVDVLVALHRLPRHAAICEGLPRYDTALLFEEVGLLVDWYVPETGPAQPVAELRESYRAAWAPLLTEIAALPSTLTLRDFHVDNLMRLRGRRGVAECGLLDFQDAVAGSPLYDLMSLLEDARRDIPPHLKSAMLRRYERAVGIADGETFHRVFAILAAHRHAKVIGIFTRLFRRDGKAGYLLHIPRVWRLLEGALCHPALSPVAAWVDRHIPPEKRIVPQATQAQRPPPPQSMECR